MKLSQTFFFLLMVLVGLISFSCTDDMENVVPEPIETEKILMTGGTEGEVIIED